MPVVVLLLLVIVILLGGAWLLLAFLIGGAVAVAGALAAIFWFAQLVWPFVLGILGLLIGAGLTLHFLDRQRTTAGRKRAAALTPEGQARYEQWLARQGNRLTPEKRAAFEKWLRQRS